MAPEMRRSGTLTAGGVLAIISGVIGIIEGLVLAIFIASGTVFTVYRDGVEGTYVFGTEWVPLAIVGIILGVLAIVGGSRALARTRFGWAITGGICALFCGILLGLLALIFIAVSKREFD